MDILDPAPATGLARRYLDMTEDGLYLNTTLKDFCRPIKAGYSDVYCAQLEDRPGEAVAVKRPRYSMDNAQMNELMDAALEKEITVLKRVRHRNILHFLGLVRYHGDPCIVTPWMKNGNLRQYLKSRPDADRLEFLRDVAVAVEYLHCGAELPETTSVIHGDIHAGNVLVSDEGKALLADFGLSKLVPLNEQASLSLRLSGKTPGLPSYMAPELHVQGALRSLCSDVFAFGMLVYETYAGALPDVPVDKLQAGQRPERAFISRHDMTDVIWRVACDCWAHLPEDRPSMQDVSATLRQAPKPDADSASVSSPIATIPLSVDLPFAWLVRKTYVGNADPELYLREKIDIPFRPLNLTNHSDIYRAHYSGRPNDVVAVKRMRYAGADPEATWLKDKELEQNVSGMRRVHHPHILDVLGLAVYHDDPCIVTPWVTNGNLRQYLSQELNVDRVDLLTQVASAIGYLHSGASGTTVIIHGDLHAGNVLINDSGEALVADFGLSTLIDPEQLASISLRTTAPEGSVSYMAPELHLPSALRTVHSDVFAFGLLVFETYAGATPKLGNTASEIILALQSGRRPERGEVTRADLTDGMWAIASDCWAHVPEDRPSMAAIFNKLRSLGDRQQFKYSIGVGEFQGSADEMENAYTSHPVFGGVPGQAFCAVFDGYHGKGGAEWCREQFHKSFLEKLRDTPHTPISDVFDATFRLADNQLCKDRSMCTVAAAFLRLERVEPTVEDGDELSNTLSASQTRRILHLANVGHTHAVLCRDGKALRLTYNHTCSDEHEAERIVSSGGSVRGATVNRRYPFTRALGMLGSSNMKRFIICTPHVTSTEVTGDDEFLILGCSGFWDVVDDQEAVDLIRPLRDAQMASALLVEHAGSREPWVDNLTVLVLRLDTHE